MANRTQVFISYSHQDKAWLERLQVHLKPLEREGMIERWDDTKIQPGAKWREEIAEAIRHAKVAVLLVSADFLASDFIATEELPPLLVGAKDEGAVILPIIVSPSRFEQTPLAQFQSVNPPSQPLMSLPKTDQETIFVRVADATHETLTARSTLRRGARITRAWRRRDKTAPPSQP
ncbi:MAG: toll/interleukin-1 receptor domain-containing protein [Gammaproteobacteria bacterium]